LKLYNTRLKYSKTHENADEKETGVHGGSGGGGGGAERRREEFKNGGQAATPSLFSFLSDVDRCIFLFFSPLFSFPSPSFAMTTARPGRRRRSAPETKPARKPSASPAVRWRGN
jgi:hypothetical protein